MTERVYAFGANLKEDKRFVFVSRLAMYMQRYNGFVFVYTVGDAYAEI